jgi:hypothetical protein
MPGYLNFELQITQLEGEQYLTRVLDAPELPDNPPEQRFTLPYTPEHLAQIIGVLSGVRRPRGTTRSAFAREFGEILFKAVFAGRIYETYLSARQEAEDRDKGLRIRLNLGRAGSLSSLPWEYLRDPAVDFLALSGGTPVIRYQKQLVRRQLLRAVLPLRILVMISAPKDLPAVDVEAERRNLERAIYSLRQNKRVDVVFLEDASLRTLQRTLRENNFHVFHFIGHGAYSQETSSGVLMLEDPHGNETSVPVRGEALARELYEEGTIRMVVLNSCQGAQFDYRDPFSGVASSLVQRGIPAVVAQQFEISDSAAVAFSDEFYRAITEGLPLEAAVAEGRRAIGAAMGGDNIEWGTPVLYLYNHPSKDIFDFPSQADQTLVRQLTSRRYAPQLIAAVVALLIFGLVALLAGALYGGTEEAEAFPPPTATAIPDVDIVISNVQITPRNPAPGQLVEIAIDIENQGSDPAPPFTYEWQSNLLDSSAGATITRRIEGLAPGGVLHDRLSVRFGWWGTFITQTRVDTLNELIEKTEQNNRAFPVRTDRSAPLVIDFNAPLPNGEFVRGNQPVATDAFAGLGFRIEAEAPPASGCGEVVPWFKFVGISQVALGTGLPSDPNACASATLVFIFSENRMDNNLEGIGSVAADIVPRAGQVTLETFSDVAGQRPLGQVSGRSTQPLTLTAERTGFARIFRVQLHSQGAPLLVDELRFTAP